MPIPFIIAGVGLTAIAGIGGAAAKAVREDYENELLDINKKTEKLIEDTKKDYQMQYESTVDEINRLQANRQRVQNKSLQQFVEKYKIIKNVNLTTRDFNVNLQIDEQLSDIYFDNTSRTGYKKIAEIDASGLVKGALFGGVYFTKNFAQGIKISYEIDEAKKQYEKVKLEVKKVQLEQSKLKNTANKINELNCTVEKLDMLFKKAILEMEKNIKQYGGDFIKYPKHAKEQLFITTNLAKLMKDLINFEVLNEKGELNHRIDSAINNATKCLNTIQNT